MGKIRSLTGNEAVATSVSLCHPEVIAAYPITPQSSVVETLSSMVSNGELDATLVAVESEHSSMSVVQGASLVGGRTFTATSANGLHLMYEPYNRQPTLRLPTVMTLATRDVMSPHTIFSSHQDAMSVRDAGWIMMFCETNQELFDMIIQSYNLSEDKDILLPVNVCYDGFFLSHLSSRVDVPSQEEVDSFLKPYNKTHAIFDPDDPQSFDPMTSGPIFMKYRESHAKAMQRVLPKVREIDKSFKSVFGRSYGGCIETYRCDDADYVIISMGSHSGTVREAVDDARNEGIKVGLLRLRFFRPFPKEEIEKVLKNVMSYAVIDRDVAYGWNTGLLYQEVRAAVSDSTAKPNFSAIGGLGGNDITLDHVKEVIIKLKSIGESDAHQYETVWLH